MKLLARLLWACLAIEVVGAGALCVAWLREPVPPQPDVARFHPATSAAIRDLERTTFQNGTSENWLALGKMYLSFGLFPEAEYCCKQAAALDATSFDAFYWWGVALNQLGETSAAIERFRQALPLAGGDAKAAARCWYGIGRNYLRQEDVASAEDAFRQAANDLHCRHQLVRILVRSGRAEEAISLLNRLIAGNPNQSAYYQLRARAYEQLGNEEGAFEDRAHVEHAPGKLRSDAIIAELQNEAGKLGVYGALRECDQLLERDPQAAVTRLRELLEAAWRTEIAGLLVEAEMKIGNAQQAIDLITEMMAREGTRAAQLAQLADNHEWLNQEQTTFELRKRAVKLRPIEALHAGLSRDYRERGNDELARKHEARAKAAAGIREFRANRISEATLKLQQAVELDKEQPAAWFYLGECRRIRGDLDRAVQAYRNCLQLDANHGRARRRLAWVINSLRGAK